MTEWLHNELLGATVGRYATALGIILLAFIILSIMAGVFSYVGLPKEGEPDIEIPALIVSVQFPGISAEDSESLLVKPMETELADIDGLDKMTGTAAEGYANIVMEFEFGWDKSAVLADVRDRMSKAEGSPASILALYCWMFRTDHLAS